MIIFNDFPLCPSINESHTVARGRIIKTQIRRQFDLNVQLWAKMNNDRLVAAGFIINQWLRSGHFLKVDAYHCFERSRVYSKKNEMKALDGNNRLKACLDGLKDCIRIDDKYYIAGNCEKVICDRKESECTILVITADRIKTKNEIFQSLQALHLIKDGS